MTIDPEDIHYSGMAPPEPVDAPAAEPGRRGAADHPRLLSTNTTESLARLLSGLTRRRVRPLVASGLLAMLPVVVDRCLVAIGYGGDWLSVAWLGIYVLLNLLLLNAPTRVWNKFVLSRAKIRGMLSTSDARLLDEWMRARLHPRMQLPLCIVVAGAGVAVTIATESYLPGDLGPAYFISIAITGFYGTDAAFWIWSAPLLIRRLGTTSSIQVRTIDPARTPGIRALSELYDSIAAYAATGMFLFGVPLLWAVFVVSQEDVVPSLLGVVPFLFTIATTAYAVFIPQRWLGHLVHRAKNEILDRLAASLSDAEPEKLVDDLDTGVRLYEKLAAAPASPSERTLVRRVLVVLGTITPYLVGAGAKLLDI